MYMYLSVWWYTACVAVMRTPPSPGQRLALASDASYQHEHRTIDIIMRM